MITLQAVLDEYVYAHKNDLKVLEAGCGSGSNIELPENRHVVGIDISQEELDKNSIVNEKIVGDLQTYKLPEKNFDLVVCWDVLEHLSRPDQALASMVSSVKEDGYLLLAFPNVFSLKGIVAKFTPVWFHTRVYRFIYGENYGKPGYITFPTYLRWTMSPNRLREFADDNNMNIIYSKIYESGVQRRFRERVFVKGPLLLLVRGLVKLFSLGTLTFTGSDCIYLLHRMK